jgi:hypothetical protein
MNALEPARRAHRPGEKIAREAGVVSSPAAQRVIKCPFHRHFLMQSV